MMNSFLFILVIGDNYLDSFYSLQDISLKFNNIHNVEIEAPSIETKLGEPYNQCKESTTDKVYHQKNCIETCISRGIQRRYNCSDAGLFAIAGLEECETPAFQLEFIDACEKKCPVGCHSVKVKFQVTSTKREDNDFTEFSFKFPDFTSLKIDQIPKMNGFSFLSNIGGSLGLFMGISFLSFIEILAFIIDVFLLAFIR